MIEVTGWYSKTKPSEAYVDEQETITFEVPEAFRDLCGPEDRYLRLFSDVLDVTLSARGNTLTLRGDEHDVSVSKNALVQFYDLLLQGHPLYSEDIVRGLNMLASGSTRKLHDVFLDTVLIAAGKRKIGPKNVSQKVYLEAIRHHDLVFGIGPAGTGKTYVAMAAAVAALTSGRIKRIILTRPAVEAGERLGFLPGDMAENVNPYLRPLYDALYDMLDAPRVERYIQDKAIEVAPLAFMRGRTLSDAFVILDEAQNTTREQMRMLLTRLGFNTKAIVTGDVTQTDLPQPGRSGLVHAQKILEGVDGIAICRFTSADVVRHPLVARIINAYEKDDSSRSQPIREV